MYMYCTCTNTCTCTHVHVLYMCITDETLCKGTALVKSVYIHDDLKVMKYMYCI